MMDSQPPSTRDQRNLRCCRYHEFWISHTYSKLWTKPFKFPPDGFQPLNAANVRPVNVISRLISIGISTWSGDSAASRNINIGMKPDFVWVKNRFVNGRSHYLYDSVGWTKQRDCF